MEILGLAVVVLLLLIGAVFVVNLVGTKAPADYRKGFVSSQTASNMLSSFLKTVSDGCSQLTMTELLQDCAQSQSVMCDDSEYSCSFVNSTARHIFSQTLDKWKYKYEFLAYREGGPALIRLGESCKGEKIPKEFIVPLSSDSVHVRLDICQ